MGFTQAENEQEPRAIAALRKSLELDPNNLDALFALAVSYTNESMENDAMSCLERWLDINPLYGGGGSAAAAIDSIHKPYSSSFLDRYLFNLI